MSARPTIYPPLRGSKLPLQRLQPATGRKNHVRSSDTPIDAQNRRKLKVVNPLIRSSGWDWGSPAIVRHRRNQHSRLTVKVSEITYGGKKRGLGETLT